MKNLFLFVVVITLLVGMFSTFALAETQQFMTDEEMSAMIGGGVNSCMQCEGPYLCGTNNTDYGLCLGWYAPEDVCVDYYISSCGFMCNYN